MDEKGKIATPDEARQAVKGHGVRYVLTFSLIGAVVAMIILLIVFVG